MAIKIKAKKHKDIPVLEITGKISSEDAIKISKRLENMAKKPFQQLVIDLSSINYLDSHWLGVFVYSWRLFQENNKELIFCIPPGFVLDLFTNSNLDRSFKIIHSLDSI
ncbi:MAG: anti-sigma factor antagonist [Chitinivibrionales bacterium]|nr:anti-sigma factor antagonist [Chitinivibrionales bacterium]